MLPDSGSNPNALLQHQVKFANGGLTRFVESIGVPLAYVLTLLACQANAAQAQWRSPWLERNGHQYRMTAVMDWRSAEALAQSVGGHLVTVNDAAEHAWLFSTLMPYNTGDGATHGFFLGLLQTEGSIEPDGGWKWVNGEPLTYTNWQLDEPNNNTLDENRGHMPKGGVGLWNDVPATHLSAAVVEVADCNSNGIGDGLDVSSGTSADCNLNLIPDDCDIVSSTSPDCEGDGIANDCVVCSSISDCNDCEGATIDGCFNGTCIHLKRCATPFVPGDLDGDRDADLRDYAIFMLCLMGPSGETPETCPFGPFSP